MSALPCTRKSDVHYVQTDIQLIRLLREPLVECDSGIGTEPGEALDRRRNDRVGMVIDPTKRDRANCRASAHLAAR
jgi:hypothetical protein